MALGDGVKKTIKAKKEPLRKMAAIRVNTDLAKGSILASEMIKFAAPDGFAPYNIESLIGKVLKDPIKEDGLFCLIT